MKIVIHYTKKNATVAGIIIILSIGAVVVIAMRNESGVLPQRITSSPLSAPAQQTSEGPVDVTVTHDIKQSTRTTHVFTVVLDTHSGDLSTFDAQANIIYRTKDGKELAPQSIGGDRETHHRTITATFVNTALPDTLVIKNLRSIPERTFPITK